MPILHHKNLRLHKAVPLLLLALALALAGLPGCRAGGEAMTQPPLREHVPLSHTAPYQLQGSPENGELFWYNGKWTQEGGDVKPDPKIRFGRLGNGLRYAIIPNTRPEGRMTMFLDVQAGSLMEEDSQLGYAHFVEHLAFEGSRNFAPGSLIPFFKEHGMSFGGDSNAYTSLAETVYMLHLAGTDQDSLGTGLTVLRDFADGLSFEPQSVEQERGVILSEMTARDSEAYMAWREQQRALYAGTRFVNDVIGTEETLRGATPEKLRAFYKKWYHPGRMIVILAGDVSPPLAEPLIRQAFEDMRGNGEPPKIASFGEPQHHGLSAYYQPREISSTEIKLLIYHPRPHFKDSTAKRRQDIVDALVSICMNQRLEERKDREPGIWQSADFGNGWRSGLLPNTSMSAETVGEGWAKALAALNEELRSAGRYGLQDQELRRAREMLSTVMRRAALEEEGLDNGTIAALFSDAANNDVVHTSSAEDLRIFNSILPGIKTGDLNLALTDALNGKNLLVHVSGNAVIPGGEGEILEVWLTAERKGAKPYKIPQKPEFPYLPLPAPASSLPALERSELAPDLTSMAMYKAVMPNGAELYLLPSSYEKDRVQASFLFGKGTLTLEDQDYPLMRMTEAVLAESGVGRLSSTESNLVFAGRGFGISETYSAKTSGIYGRCSTADLTLLLQSIWTQYKDPWPEDSARQKVVEGLAMSRIQRLGTVDGVNSARGSAFFYGNARRFAALDDADAESASLEQIQDFIAGTRGYGPIRVIISGDFDPQAALPEAVRLFGGDPIPGPDNTRNAPYPVFPSGIQSEIQVPDKVDKAVIRMAWKKDFKDVNDRSAYAARQVLAQVLDDRLVEELRMKMGATYSPFAYYTANAADDGFGYMSAEVVADTASVEACREAMSKVAEDLARQGVSPEDLEFARKPMRTELRTSFQRPGAWHALLERQLTLGLPYLEWAKTRMATLNRLTARDISREAKSVFAEKNKAVIVIKTVNAPPETAPRQAG